MRKDLLAGVGVGIGALIGGAAYQYFRERSLEEPDFRALETEGDYQLRHYPALTVAETLVRGSRRDALGQAFRRLSDYLQARPREGARLAMTAPVLQDGGDPMASDPPLFDDALEGAWRTRFIMPADRAVEALPRPSEGVAIARIPERRVAVVSFAGRATDQRLAEQEDRLRGWLARRGEQAGGEPEYAFYNSPMIPGPLRRNEVWLPLP